ncbi:MAG: hypothetical protein V1870_04365 [Candidatus Aenigmatarchaeota archaeon]
MITYVAIFDRRKLEGQKYTLYFNSDKATYEAFLKKIEKTSVRVVKTGYFEWNTKEEAKSHAEHIYEIAVNASTTGTLNMKKLDEYLRSK